MQFQNFPVCFALTGFAASDRTVHRLDLNPIMLITGFPMMQISLLSKNICIVARRVGLWCAVGSHAALKYLHALAANAGTCAFPVALSLSTLEEIPLGIL